MSDYSSGDEDGRKLVSKNENLMMDSDGSDNGRNAGIDEEKKSGSGDRGSAAGSLDSKEEPDKVSEQDSIEEEAQSS